MERATVDVYEARGALWARSRKAVLADRAAAFGAGLGKGTLRLDVGCGAGRYLAELGRPAVGLDAARTMLDLCREAAPLAPLVQGDIEQLPFGTATVGGAWATMSYLHVPRVRLPMALADLHRVLVCGAPVELQLLAGDYEGDQLPGDDVGQRFFASWQPGPLRDVLVGAGFEVVDLGFDDDTVVVAARRTRSLADTVGPGMRLLFVGLNPSLYAADAGVGFARRSNRFWPALTAAGLCGDGEGPRTALYRHRLGLTDLVKRATAGAGELERVEYRHGMGRIERLAAWLRPQAMCFVGLAGWRAAVDPHARCGPQPQAIGGRPCYVMPSTSGANAHARLGDLVDHLRAAARLADDAA